MIYEGDVVSLTTFNRRRILTSIWLSLDYFFFIRKVTIHWIEWRLQPLKSEDSDFISYSRPWSVHRKLILLSWMNFAKTWATWLHSGGWKAILVTLYVVINNLISSCTYYLAHITWVHWWNQVMVKGSHGPINMFFLLIEF